MAEPHVTSAPELFGYVRTVLSIVVSLGIARLLSGTSQFVQHPGRRPVYWVHLVWAVSMLLMLLHFWWWEFSLGQLRAWRFETYLFVVLYAALFYLLCTILFPDDLVGYAGYRDYYYSRRTWFFGLLALTFLFDIVDTRLKGDAHCVAQGLEYRLRIGGYLILCVIAAATRNARFHAGFAVANLLYQISWIFRQYDVLR